MGLHLPFIKVANLLTVSFIDYAITPLVEAVSS
jgi:hypothetical protein